MTGAGEAYNPLDRVNLGRSVERALLARSLGPLPPERAFPGAGLYAIYYLGDFEPYQPIAPPARPVGDMPIYVGRAIPRGARAGIGGLLAATTEPVMFHRLREHARSIQQAEERAANTSTANLRLRDFRCRYLVVDDIWVPLAEALLIGHYQPVWNQVLQGFGNHAPGKGRYEQARSDWDALHPGRPWADRLGPPERAAAECVAAIAAHVADLPAPNLEQTPTITPEVLRAVVDEPDSPAGPEGPSEDTGSSYE